MKRVLWILLICLILCSCSPAGKKPSSGTPNETGTRIDTEAAETPNISDSAEDSADSVGEAGESESRSPETDAPDVDPTHEKLNTEKLLHTDGRLIISPEGEQILIKGIALGNDVYGNRTSVPTNHHTEDTYRTLAEMGFNSVRFYLNYGLFEDDSAPYEYKEQGFDWIEQNVQWAKKHGIGIIFNMHYPQGGYQSQGKGDALWNGRSNQDRLSALWCEIASRYCNEPAVWGYGLINEPVVTWKGSKAATIEFYRSVMQRLTDDLRKVTNQAVFVEKICAADMGEDADWSAFSLDEAMVLLEGENIVYEFHSYNPHSFTHQDFDWANTLGKTSFYPDDTNLKMTVDKYWVDCLRSKKVSEKDGWGYFEASKAYGGNEEYNFGFLALNASKLGKGSTAYFDDLTVTEISPDGKETVLVTADFNTDTSASFDAWSSDGSGMMSYVGDKGHSEKGCIMIRDTAGDFTASKHDRRFVLKKGYTYKVSGYIKQENTDRATVRIDFGHATEISAIDKSYLESGLMPAISFSEKNNVPIYLGEFGAGIHAFENDRGGDRWVRDMLEICRAHSLSFNYHTYHEANFGLYTSWPGKLPSESDLNKVLYDTLLEGLKN